MTELFDVVEKGLKMAQCDSMADDPTGCQKCKAFAALAKLKEEHGEISHQMEFDRAAVADCITKANKAIDSRHYLTEGRGSYEWNDDRWHDEFRAAAMEIKASLEPLTKIATDWKGCPQTSEEAAKARIDLKQQFAALTAEIKAHREALTRIGNAVDPVEGVTGGPDGVETIIACIQCGLDAANVAHELRERNESLTAELEQARNSRDEHKAGWEGAARGAG